MCREASLTGGGGRGGSLSPPFFFLAREEMMRSCWDAPDPEPGLPTKTYTYMQNILSFWMMTEYVYKHTKFFKVFTNSGELLGYISSNKFLGLCLVMIMHHKSYQLELI